jgi:hypothetical protein
METDNTTIFTQETTISDTENFFLKLKENKEFILHMISDGWRPQSCSLSPKLINDPEFMIKCINISSPVLQILINGKFRDSLWNNESFVLAALEISMDYRIWHLISEKLKENRNIILGYIEMEDGFQNLCRNNVSIRSDREFTIAAIKKNPFNIIHTTFILSEDIELLYWTINSPKYIVNGTIYNLKRIIDYYKLELNHLEMAIDYEDKIIKTDNLTTKIILKYLKREKPKEFWLINKAERIKIFNSKKASGKNKIIYRNNFADVFISCEVDKQTFKGIKRSYDYI